MEISKIEFKYAKFRKEESSSAIDDLPDYSANGKKEFAESINTANP